MMLLYLNQEKILYHPSPYMKTVYPTIVLERSDVNVTIHVVHPGKADALLYFGGNGESMAMSAEYIAKQFPEMTCYLMDYRGYGSSTGEPGEAAIYSDALKLYDHVEKNHRTISVAGRSLGSGVAAYVASQRPVHKLLMVTPYDSIESIAQERYPFIPVSWLLKDKYNVLAYISKITAPTMIIAADDDHIISFDHTQKLIDAFPKDGLKVVVIENSGHNDITYHRSYYHAVQHFMMNN